VPGGLPVKGAISAYDDCYWSQVAALGIAGQRRLQRASVLIAGAGGLGTAIATVLATTGVGRLVIVDPQRIEVENINRYPFMRPRDVGRPKVEVLAGFFEGRPHLSVIPIVARAESIPAMRLANDVHVFVSAANTAAARCFVAALAVRRQVMHVAAAVMDGREGQAGLITTWVPGQKLACPACFLEPRTRFARGESLLTPVVSVVGGIAAGVVVELLVRPNGQPLDAGNYLSVSLDSYAMERLRVQRRDDCPACTTSRRLIRRKERPR
jgi:molybdopterin/thiamine biosynthesis adenylyltransferase